MAARDQALAPFTPENIPDELKARKRWAPWEAIWSERRRKYDNLPRRPDGYGLSTARPERWFSFQVALDARVGNPKRFAGVGYVLHLDDGVIGIDLDNCVHGGQIDDWALEIVRELNSYTELSPSGGGLRIWINGSCPNDWTNHERGIEVYSGHEPRFLTVTGQRLGFAPAALASPDPAILAAITAKHARERSAEVVDIVMPELLDELALPDVADLEVPYQVKDLLAGQSAAGDRSRALAHAAVALYSAGHNDAEVFSILVNNPYTFQIALDHRNQDSDRAQFYIWRHHCCKGKSKASSKVASDFEDDSRTTLPTNDRLTTDPANLVDSANLAPVAKRERFAALSIDEFLNAPPIRWLVKRVIPQAEIGVVYGASGSGKSFFLLDLCMAVALGKPWRGLRVKQGTVVYICAEGAGGFRLRVEAYRRYHGVEGDIPFLVIPASPSFMEKGDIKELVAALRKVPSIAMIVVDTWSQVTAGADENSGQDMGRALVHCRAIHDATGAMVMVAAHTGKDESRGQRGWGGVKGFLDTEIYIERSDDYRQASVTKLKDGEGEREEYPFKLTSVVLGHDEDGDDVTSCVLSESSKVSKAQRRAQPKGDIQRIVLRVAVALTDLAGEVSTQDLIDSAVNELPREEAKKDSRKYVVTRAMESLVSANLLSTAGGKVHVL